MYANASVAFPPAQPRGSQVKIVNCEQRNGKTQSLHQTQGVLEVAFAAFVPSSLWQAPVPICALPIHMVLQARTPWSALKLTRVILQLLQLGPRCFLPEPRSARTCPTYLQTNPQRADHHRLPRLTHGSITFPWARSLKATTFVVGHCEHCHLQLPCPQTVSVRIDCGLEL